MAEKKEIKEYRYVGNCPVCGTEQEDRSETQADRVCDNCRKQQANETFMTKLAFLRGTKILDFKGECSLNYDGSLNACSISEITVSRPDGRVIRVTTSRGLWQAVES